MPRNIIVKGNAAGIAGDVIVTGINYLDEEITETIALNGATGVEGAKAFKTISSIHVPAETHAGTDTVSVGVGDKLGLPCKLALNTVLAAYLNGTREAALPTVAVDKDQIENNTVSLGSALARQDVDIFMMLY